MFDTFGGHEYERHHEEMPWLPAAADETFGRLAHADVVQLYEDDDLERARVLRYSYPEERTVHSDRDATKEEDETDG